ncbi:MAG: MFS transporter [Acetobacteraceae bacterium]
MPEGSRLGLFLASSFAAGAVLTAYLPLWMADRGLSAPVIGQILGLAALLRLVAVPAWGWAADRFGRPRMILFMAAAAAAGSTAALAGAGGVVAVTLLVAIGGIAAAALAPLGDALTIALARARRLEYGRTRAWGSVSFMLATALAGAVLGQTGSGVVPLLLAAGYGGAALLAPTLPVPERLPLDPGRKPARLSRLFRLALLATALIQGSHAAYYAFASLHWRAAGISDAHIGLLIAEGIVAEIALFLWGRRLVERLGPVRLTAVAACCCALRWTLTALTVAEPLLAAVQILHAGTFACQHLSSMMVLRGLPPGRAGWAQAMMAAVGFYAPTGLLTWLSGRIYAERSGQVFLLMAVVGGSALLVVPWLHRAMRRP